MNELPHDGYSSLAKSIKFPLLGEYRSMRNMTSKSKLSAAYHIERSIVTRQGLAEYPCGCKDCRGAKILKESTVARHHRQRGRDPYLQYSVLSEDGEAIKGPTEEGLQEGEDYFRGLDRNERGSAEFVWPERTNVDVGAAVRDAYARVDHLHNSMQEEEVDDSELEDDENFDAHGADYEELVRESQEAIYEGSNLNRLEVAIVLVTMCSLFSIPYTFLDELLKFLSQDLLPKSNSLPRTSYEARRMVLKLGLKHKAIHCCPDGHVLFRGDKKDLVACPHEGCGKSRYVEGSSTVPCKILRYFPIIEQLRRMFRCPKIADMMTFHNSNKSEEPLMKSVVDGEQWKHIDESYPDFASVATNLRIGLVGDGVNPYGNQSSRHSIWPLLVAIYNLPPWMTNKTFFLKLVLLIPGPHAPAANVVDTYLEPLVEDLLKLWEGVPTVDMSKANGHRRFSLREVLMWFVHDFPAYGLFLGQQTKGYRGCPLCASDTCAEHSSSLRKIVYLGARRFLHMQHRFRNARRAFNGKSETRNAPKRRTGHEVYADGLEREQYLSEGGVPDGEDDPVKKHGVKRVSVFFSLPYWADLPCRHTLDVMHCEKNVCETSLKFLLGENDTAAVRLDLQERKLRSHLWLQETCPGSTKFFIPDAEYVLSVADKATFLHTLRSLKTPSRYVSNIRQKIEKGKLRGLKSHDFHVIMQQILPLCVRNIQNQELASGIIRLSRIFQRVCDKVISKDSKNQLLEDVAETMALLEKQLPPAAFNIMMHLPYHIVQELFICGPVQNRWMYPFERYYKELKGYVRNLAKLEGSMAASYEVEEAAGYVTEYMLDYSATCSRVWDSEQDPKMIDEILEVRGITRALTDERREMFHNFVIDTSGNCEEYREQYRELKAQRDEERRLWRRRHPQRIGRRGTPYPINLSEFPSFAKWFQEDVESAVVSGVEVPDIVMDISTPPNVKCKKFRSMWAFGSHFRVASYEKSLLSQDSGVAATFIRPWRASARDRNVVEADVEYIGELQEIVELDCQRTCVVVFVCRWVRANYRGANATVKKDKWGFTIANFQSCQRFGKESFAFPKHCQQVFYSDASELPGWRVVLRPEVRGRRVDNLSEVTEMSPLFARGNDSDYEGLRAPENISEDILPRALTAREVGREEVFHQTQRENKFFDRDLGDSSDSN